MTAPAPRRGGRALASIAAIAVLVIVVPATLIAVSRARFGGGAPWHGVDPTRWSLAGVVRTLGERLDDGTVVDLVVRSALGAVWMAILVILATTVAEVLHLRRHRGIAAPPVRGLGWAQCVGHFIAAGLIVATPVITPLAAMARNQTSALGFAGAVPSSGSVVGASWNGAAVDRNRHDAAVGAPGRAHTAESVERSDESAPHGRRVHVVVRGESVYSIAADLADGDPALTEDLAMAIIDANLGTAMPGGQRFTNPAYIEPGWRLVVPGHSDQAPDPVVSSPEEDAPAIHTVEPGDTLSDIAGEHLGDPDGWPDIWEANAGAEMPGGRRFDDPHLILPGWELELPASAASPVTVDASNTSDDHDEDDHDESHVADADDAAVDRRSAPTPVAGEPPGGTIDGQADGSAVSGPSDDGRGGGDGGTAVEVVSTPAPRPPMTTAPVTASAPAMPTIESTSESPDLGPPSGTTGAPRSDSPPDTSASGATIPAGSASRAGTPESTASTEPVAAAGEDSASEPGEVGAPAAPSPLRLEHAAMLAAGILALVAVRRRGRLRRARPRSRVPDPHPDVTATERRLRIVEPGERALRADVAMRAAAAHIADDAEIGLVTVSGEGDVALRLTAPAALPAPWEGSDTTWTLPAGVPIELLGADARRVGAPCIALAQLGTTEDGHDVLIDLEACGTLAIEARGDQGDEVLRALAAGLASSIHAEVAHLIGVGSTAQAFLGHRNSHAVDDVDGALELAAALVGSTLSSERSSFGLRALRTGGEMWEPAVVMLTSEDDTARGALPPIPPGQGCAVVAVTTPGGLSGAPTRLVGRSDGWRLHAFGAELGVRPIGLTTADLGDVTAVLDDAGQSLLDEDTTVGRGRHEAIEPDLAQPGGDAADDGAGTVRSAAPFTPRQHTIVVHLLDRMAIRSADGEAARFERSKTVELVAWLATHRTRMTRSAARTALWELDVRDATFANVVSEARRGLARLVQPPEGDEWLGRTLTEELPLHDLVVTDGELIEERMVAARPQPPAEAIETLRPAVELIAELPFAGTAYLWPDADGITSDLLLLATGAAAELAAHALAVGDIELVFWATGRGLQVLPGHEELIGLRMRAHANAGDLAAVRQEWEAYERVIVADAWSDGEPAPKLVELRHELLRPGA